MFESDGVTSADGAAQASNPSQSAQPNQLSARELVASRGTVVPSIRQAAAAERAMPGAVERITADAAAAAAELVNAAAVAERARQGVIAAAVLPEPVASVLPWLARHQFTLYGHIMVSEGEAVILVDRGQPEPGVYARDRWVTWRCYSRQAEPHSGSYFVNFHRALSSLAARAGVITL